MSTLVPKVEQCIQEVKEWSRLNGLKLNSNKTEVLHISSRFRLYTPFPNIEIDGTQVIPVKKAKNLGVIIDNQFTLQDYVSSKCRSATFALYKINKIRPYIDKETTERLVHAFVMYYIDYCNSLVYGLPDTQLQKLQVIQNSAARLITRTKKHESISHIVRALHWLPIRSRIAFKILLLTYQCFNELAPSYLTELLVKYNPVRRLRSAQQDLYIVPNISTNFYGKRSFQHAASALWNDIPYHIKHSSSLNTFKSSLKTHLFNN